MPAAHHGVAYGPVPPQTLSAALNNVAMNSVRSEASIASARLALSPRAPLRTGSAALLGRHMMPEDEQLLREKGQREAVLRDKRDLQNQQRQEAKARAVRERELRGEEEKRKEEEKEKKLEEARLQRFWAIERKQAEAERRQREREMTKAEEAAADSSGVLIASTPRRVLASPRPFSPRSPLTSPRQSPVASWGLRPSGGDRQEEAEERRQLLLARAARERLLLAEKETRAREQQQRAEAEATLRRAQTSQFDVVRDAQEQRRQQDMVKKQRERVVREEKADRKAREAGTRSEQVLMRGLRAQGAQEQDRQRRQLQADQARVRSMSEKGDRERVYLEAKHIRQRQQDLAEKQRMLANHDRDAQAQVQREAQERRMEEERKRRIVDLEAKNVRAEDEGRRRREFRERQQEEEVLQRGSPLFFDNPAPRNAKEARAAASALGLSPRLSAAAASSAASPRPQRPRATAAA